MKWVHRISGRGQVAFAHDIIMAGLSFMVAMYLRVGATDYKISFELLLEGAMAMAIAMAPSRRSSKLIL